jgi:hypothetical protein
MSSTDQFWQFAKEALYLALSAESDDERKCLVELSETWTRAAIVERQLSAPMAPISSQPNSRRYVF